MRQFTREQLRERAAARRARRDRRDKRRSSVPGCARRDGPVCRICQMERVPHGTFKGKSPTCGKCREVIKRIGRGRRAPMDGETPEELREKRYAHRVLGGQR